MSIRIHGSVVGSCSNALFWALVVVQLLREVWFWTRIKLTVGDTELGQTVAIGIVAGTFLLGALALILFVEWVYLLMRKRSVSRMQAWWQAQAALRAGFLPARRLGTADEEVVVTKLGLMRWYTEQMSALSRTLIQAVGEEMTERAKTLLRAVDGIEGALKWACVKPIDPNEIGWSNLGKAKLQLAAERKVVDLRIAEGIALGIEQTDVGARTAAIAARAEQVRVTTLLKQLDERSAEITQRDAHSATLAAELEQVDAQLRDDEAKVKAERDRITTLAAQAASNRAELASLVIQRNAWASFAADQILALIHTEPSVRELVAAQLATELSVSAR